MGRKAAPWGEQELMDEWRCPARPPTSTCQTAELQSSARPGLCVRQSGAAQ